MAADVIGEIKSGLFGLTMTESRRGRDNVFWTCTHSRSRFKGA